MVRYYIQKTSCFLLSLLLAFSIVGLAIGASLVGFYRNEGFVKSSIDNNKQAIIESINEELTDAAEVLNLPSEALTGVIDDSNFSIISSELARNFIYIYPTDLSGNAELYNAFASGISAYSSENSLALSSEEITAAASYSVDAVSFVLSGNATASTKIFIISQDRRVMYLVLGSIALIIASIVGIDYINRGRHRRFSYIGMGVVTAGYILVGTPLFVKYMGFLDSYKFCSFDAYNVFIRDITDFVINVITGFGALILIAGIVMLLVNYNYFRKKGARALRKKEINEQIKNDYLFDIQPVSKNERNEDGDFEKEVMKIDFED